MAFNFICQCLGFYILIIIDMSRSHAVLYITGMNTVYCMYTITLFASKKPSDFIETVEALEWTVTPLFFGFVPPSIAEKERQEKRVLSSLLRHQLKDARPPPYVRYNAGTQYPPHTSDLPAAPHQGARNSFVMAWSQPLDTARPSCS